jgi:hypothetical protein
LLSRVACASIIAAQRLIDTPDGRISGVNDWTMRRSSLDTIARRIHRPDPPQTPTMTRSAIKLSLLTAHLTSENAAVVQACVPFVEINGDSYRMRAHRDAIQALRPAITGGEKP